MHRWAPVFLLLAIGLAGPASASAEPSKDEKRAFELRKFGVSLQAKGKHDLALEAFEDALKLSRHSEVVYFHARSLDVLGRVDEACAGFAEIRDAQDLRYDQQAYALEKLALCDERARRVEVSFDPRRIEGVSLQIDGEDAGMLPLTHALAPGKHEIQATCEDCLPWKELIDVTLPGPMLVAVKVTRVTVSKPYPVAPISTKVEIGSAPLETSTPLRQVLGWSGVGVGAALVATGVGFLGHYAYIEGQDLAPGQRIEGNSTDLVLGGTCAGVGAALAATGVVLLLTGDDAPKAALVPAGNGVVLVTTF